MVHDAAGAGVLRVAQLLGLGLGKGAGGVVVHAVIDGGGARLHRLGCGLGRCRATEEQGATHEHGSSEHDLSP